MIIKGKLAVGKQHSGIQIIFLISSPLQALACWLIIKDNSFLKKSNIIVFTEGYYTLPNDSKFIQIELKNTRKNKKNIKDNIEIITSKVHGKCELWVSELLWPMNNALYSNLKVNNRIESVNFFDEGVVMYFNITHTSYQYARELIKSFILKFYFKNYTFPSKRMFSESEKNGRIAIFNPELIDGFKNVEKISIKQKIVNQFTQCFIQKNHVKEIDSINKSKEPVLILSQPYYRVMKSSKFDEIFMELKKYLNSRGFRDVFIKLHPSESLKDYQSHYHHLGFKLVFSELQSTPAEILLSKLNRNVKVLSFGTSAFINARKFGFYGEMILYKFEKFVLNIVPFQARRHITLLTDLYKKSGCNIVN
ncbi:alpha-2,8-polysialyltransferase family protein [Alphaproteobacteria bacterium]|nr:alpha-2,8-polysialyltransferase family protein [Alphaproteobacteria bacterium]